mmetsp:Transcript_6561/g.9534  ORF Transcript_6561/g.9534 Transcript_6561/m.9534 type:complete len:726 (-) Transcript_6561:1242-3419(-)
MNLTTQETMKLTDLDNHMNIYVYSKIRGGKQGIPLFQTPLKVTFHQLGCLPMNSATLNEDGIDCVPCKRGYYNLQPGINKSCIPLNDTLDMIQSNNYVYDALKESWVGFIYEKTPISFTCNNMYCGKPKMWINLETGLVETDNRCILDRTGFLCTQCPYGLPENDRCLEKAKTFGDGLFFVLYILTGYFFVAISTILVVFLSNRKLQHFYQILRENPSSLPMESELENNDESEHINPSLQSSYSSNENKMSISSSFSNLTGMTLEKPSIVKAFEPKTHIDSESLLEVKKKIHHDNQPTPGFHILLTFFRYTAVCISFSKIRPPENNNLYNNFLEISSLIIRLLSLGIVSPNLGKLKPSEIFNFNLKTIFPNEMNYKILRNYMVVFPLPFGISFLIGLRFFLSCCSFLSSRLRKKSFKYPKSCLKLFCCLKWSRFHELINHFLLVFRDNCLVTMINFALLYIYNSSEDVLMVLVKPFLIVNGFNLYQESEHPNVECHLSLKVFNVCFICLYVIGLFITLIIIVNPCHLFWSRKFPWIKMVKRYFQKYPIIIQVRAYLSKDYKHGRRYWILIEFIFYNILILCKIIIPICDIINDDHIKEVVMINFLLLFIISIYIFKPYQFERENNIYMLTLIIIIMLIVFESSPNNIINNYMMYFSFLFFSFFYFYYSNILFIQVGVKWILVKLNPFFKQLKKMLLFVKKEVDDNGFMAGLFSVYRQLTKYKKSY